MSAVGRCAGGVLRWWRGLTPLFDDVMIALRVSMAIAFACWTLVLMKSSKTNPATWTHLPMTSIAFVVIITTGCCVASPPTLLPESTDCRRKNA